MGVTFPVCVSEGAPGPDVLSALAALCAEREDVALLHSAAGESASVLAAEPLVTVEVDAVGGVHIRGLEGGWNAHPLEVMEWAVNAVSFDAPHPLVGWLGFVSYDIGRTLEAIGDSARDEMRWPLLRWTLYRHYWLHDPVRGEWTAVGVGGDAMPLPAAGRLADVGVGRGQVIEAISAEAYRAKVERVKAYIAAGDIYQANLAQRWAVATEDSAADVYRRLCGLSPAPYGGFLRFRSADGVMREVMSASPELFLNVASERLVTRPIKGTRRRDLTDAAHDEALRAELVASEKDKAELAMIVDLMRNDLGRVAEYGSVRVDAAREVEKHPNVWHTVATVSSQLRADAGLAELLRAVCPGGSITGAPKIRAMQIIEELEGFRRGLYCGNIGVIGAEARTMTLNIAIRTILMQEGVARVFAGGGIVADSDAQGEYDETLVKASAMLRALGVERL
jgi:para-aminobenzoate synthetase component 1